MDLLDNPVRPYAWGSRSVIAGLLGQPVPSPHPQAELWLGAHPGDPSRLVGVDGTGSRSLLDALRDDPEGMLGPQRAGYWDGRLPFLLKVLAADEPLSLQAHPSAQQAAVGFAREDAQGIPRDAPERNYRDPSHKPELICALSEFHALVGFRDAQETVRLLRALAVDDLAAHVELLAGDPNEDGMRALFTTWITLPQHALDKLVPAVQDGCVRLLQQFAESASPAAVASRYGAPGWGEYFDAEARTVLELSERYPGDAGVLAALLLNRVTLEPGEAIYLPAGNLHSYLSGAGIELQANSDNVLRGGLTPKHVDVPELLRVLDFRCGPARVQRGETDGPWTRYDTPAEEFRLSRLDWATPGPPVGLPDSGGRILLCTDGTAVVDSGLQAITLHRGQSVWLSAADHGVTVGPQSPPTQLFLATDGLDADPPG